MFVVKATAKFVVLGATVMFEVRPLPDASKDWLVDALPAVVAKPVRLLGETVKVEAATVPLTATFCVVAFVLATVTLPEGEPADAPVRRTEIDVDATVPLLGVSVTDAAKLVPLVDTAYPVGAVIVMLPDKFVPLALKVCAVDGVPTVVLKPLRFAGEAVTVGVFTVPLTATFCVVAPLLATVTLPEGEPADAPVRRTEIEVDATVPPLGVSVTDAAKVVPLVDTA